MGNCLLSGPFPVQTVTQETPQRDVHAGLLRCTITSLFAPHSGAPSAGSADVSFLAQSEHRVRVTSRVGPREAAS